MLIFFHAFSIKKNIFLKYLYIILPNTHKNRFTQDMHGHFFLENNLVLPERLRPYRSKLFWGV